MKVHLIRKESIDGFIVGHARSMSSFDGWLKKLKGANWRSPDDIRQSYPTVDFLGNGCPRVVFDIGGNNYRMICKYVFGVSYVRLYVSWIGTHAEYTHLCRRGLQYSINQF
jgi:mRNA interferase HigB